MTPPKAPDSPDDENGRDEPQAVPSDGFGAPPPPQWLSDDPQAGSANLLPEPPPSPAPPAAEEAAPEAADEPEDDSAEDKTIVGGDLAGAYKTQVVPQKPGAPEPQDAEPEEGGADGGEPTGADGGADGPEPPAPPAPEPASMTSTDIPLPPPFPYAQGDPDVTHIDQNVPQLGQAGNPAAQPSPQPPLPAPPAPPAPPSASPPAMSPHPVAQPPAQQPPAPAPPPFPYAQEIPGTPAAPAPAPEPFPYAQEIPGTPGPSSSPPAAEPFPYAQEIPSGGAVPLPPASGAEPFPYAQEIPGRPQQPPAYENAQLAPARPAPLPPPPSVDEPWRTAAGPGKAKRKRSKKPLLIGVAGVAVAAVVAAGGFFVVTNLGGDDGDGGGKESARLAASVFPVEGGARTDGRDQELNGVASVGSTVVAVGGESDAVASRSLFLVSGDGGRTYRPAAQSGPDGGAPRPGETPQAVGGSSGGWVAVGTRAGGTGVVWTSENGQEWRREPDAVGSVFGAGDRVRRIVASGGGFMAIGDHSQKGDFSDAAPAVWLSGDGRRWEARTGQQIGVQIDRGSFSLVEAAASGNVILLEGLVTPGRNKPSYRKVWRSDDGGRTWSVSDVPVPKGSRGLVVGGGEAGFLALREIRSGGRAYGQVFSSKDGAQWRRTGNLTTAGYQRTNQVLGDGQGFAAIVVRGRDVLLSRSANGASWKDAGTVETRPQREIRGGALAGPQTVLVGREPGGGDMDPMLGVWDAAGTAVPVDLGKVPGAIRPDHTVRSVGANGGDLAVAVGSASGDAAAWTSTDGGAWKPAQGLGAAFTRPGPQQLLDVAGGKAGWLAVGYDQASPRRALVVTSADGASWQAADSAAAFRATRDGVPVTSAAASGPGGYVVVGTEGYSAVTWSSADLRTWERGTGGGRNALRGGKDASHWMLDVAAGSSGYAAVGGGRDGKGNHPSVWTSQDGRRWTLQVLRLPGGGITEGHLTNVAARGNTLVATGIGATPQGLAWLGYVSSDAGRTWRPLPAPGGTSQVIVTAMAATPKGFAATGTVLKDGGADVVSWTSADGASWKSATPGGTGLGGAGDQQITGLAAFRNSLLGVGRSTDARADQPVLWSRPVP